MCILWMEESASVKTDQVRVKENEKVCKNSMCVKEKGTTNDKLERVCVFSFLMQTYHACIFEIEKRGEEIHEDS